MTRDDIIHMAKEAGWERVGRNPETGPEFPILIGNLERFASLVIAAEREACAKVCDQLSWKLNDDITRAAFTMAADIIRAR